MSTVITRAARLAIIAAGIGLVVACGQRYKVGAYFDSLATGLKGGARCKTPFAIPDATVNVALIPYSYEGQPYAGRTFLGGRLPFAFGQELLGSRVAVPVGMTSYIDFNCELEAVKDRLFSSNDVRRVTGNNGVVVLSGSIYRQEGEEYVQSELLFERRGLKETIETKVETGMPNVKGEMEVFSATLPTQRLSFGAHILPSVIVRRVHGVASTFSLAIPSKPSTGKAVKLDLRKGIKYKTLELLERDGSKLGLRLAKLQVQQSKYVDREGSIGIFDRKDRVGWVALPVNDLRDVFPELHFLEGVIAYLDYRIARDATEETERTAATRMSVLDEIERAMIRYLAKSGKVDSKFDRSVAVATARGLLGISLVLESEQRTNPHERVRYLQKGVKYLTAATTAAPALSGFHNLLAVARLKLCCAQEELVEIQEAFLAGIYVNPRDREILDNYYKFLKLLIDRQGSSMRLTGIPVSQHLNRLSRWFCRQPKEFISFHGTLRNALACSPE